MGSFLEHAVDRCSADPEALGDLRRAEAQGLQLTHLGGAKRIVLDGQAGVLRFQQRRMRQMHCRMLRGLRATRFSASAVATC
jgi:hypothetical protein